MTTTTDQETTTMTTTTALEPGARVRITNPSSRFHGWRGTITTGRPAGTGADVELDREPGSITFARSELEVLT